MGRKRIFEVDQRKCLFILLESGTACRAPVVMGSALPLCDRHQKTHDRLVEVMNESTPLQLPRGESKQAL